MKGIVNRGLDASQVFRQRQIVQPKAKQKVIIAAHHHHFFYYYNIRSVCCIEFYVITQVILAFSMVLAYDLLEYRRTIDVIVTKFSLRVLKWRKDLRI